MAAKKSLNYQIEGAGEPLLLLHGMGVTFSIWQNLAPLLHSHYKLIMVELPGHGASQVLPPGQSYYAACAGQIEILRQELEIERWSILSYSMGAWAAQSYINSFPDRVNAAIFVCPALLTPLWSGGLKGLRSLDDALPALCTWLLEGWRLKNLVNGFGFNGRDSKSAQEWAREIQSQPVQTIKNLLRDLPGFGRQPFKLPPIPTLFVWGDQDIVTARPSPARPVDRIIHGCHSAPVRSAQAVADAILEYFTPYARSA